MVHVIIDSLAIVPFLSLANANNYNCASFLGNLWLHYPTIGLINTVIQIQLHPSFW